MQNLYVSKIIKVGTSKAIVIPVDIMKSLALERGDLIVFGVYKVGQFICRKLSPFEVENLKPREILID